MPVYEFKCNQCNKKSSLFFKSFKLGEGYRCPHCGSDQLKRLISSFAFHLSEQSVHEKYGEPQMFQDPGYYKDPRNIGRWAEKRMKDMGMEMPEKTREMIQAAREGDLPEPLKDLKPGPSEI